MAKALQLLLQLPSLSLQLLPLVVRHKLVPRRGQVDPLRDQGARGHQRGCLFLLRAQARAVAGQGSAAASRTPKGEGGDGGAVVTVVGEGIGSRPPIFTQLLKGLQRGRRVPGQGQQLWGAMQGGGLLGLSLGKGEQGRSWGARVWQCPFPLLIPRLPLYLNLQNQLFRPQQLCLQLCDLLLHGQHNLPKLL